MIEKFSDYESAGFLKEEGTFEFEVKEFELTDGKKGVVAKFVVESPEAGKTTIRHSLALNARWSYNNLIKACLKLDTPEKIKAFECDYETIGRDLIGKHFIGEVKAESYTKTVKTPQEDGTFEEHTEDAISYKIVSYKSV